MDKLYIQLCYIYICKEGSKVRIKDRLNKINKDTTMLHRHMQRRYKSYKIQDHDYNNKCEQW